MRRARQFMSFVEDHWLGIAFVVGGSLWVAKVIVNMVNGQ